MNGYVVSTLHERLKPPTKLSVALLHYRSLVSLP